MFLSFLDSITLSSYRHAEATILDDLSADNQEVHPYVFEVLQKWQVRQNTSYAEDQLILSSWSIYIYIIKWSQLKKNPLWLIWLWNIILVIKFHTLETNDNEQQITVNKLKQKQNIKKTLTKKSDPQ